MTYKKIPLTTSEPIWQRIAPSPEASETIDLQSEPQQCIADLLAGRHFIDLSNFIAHALPMRESIWWSANVLELRWEDWNALERDTLVQCKNWILEPHEAQRRLIEQRLATLGHGCAVGWLAQAVFWNGSDSITAVDQPVVLPVDYLYAKAVSGAVNTAALKPEWQGYEQYYNDATAIAEDIANGGRGTLKTSKQETA
jgi:hypothetical protein